MSKSFFDIPFSYQSIATTPCSKPEVAANIKHFFSPLFDATSIEELKGEGGATAATGVSRAMSEVEQTICPTMHFIAMSLYYVVRYHFYRPTPVQSLSFKTLISRSAD